MGDPLAPWLSDRVLFRKLKRSWFRIRTNVSFSVMSVNLDAVEAYLDAMADEGYSEEQKAKWSYQVGEEVDDVTARKIVLGEDDYG